MNKIYAVTGTLHGSIIEAINEGQARKIFHKKYNGESILLVKDISTYNVSNL
jgi:outer membrane lipoprotein SlyB